MDKKKVLIIILDIIVIMSLIFIAMSKNENDIVLSKENNYGFNIDISSKKEFVNPGDTVTFDIDVADISMGESGLNAITANLQYDETLFEYVEVTGAKEVNKWDVQLKNSGFGYKTCYFYAMHEGITEEQQIATLKLHVKESIEPQITEIKFFDIKSTNGEVIVRISDKVVEMNLSDGSNLRLDFQKYDLSTTLIIITIFVLAILNVIAFFEKKLIKIILILLLIILFIILFLTCGNKILYGNRTTACIEETVLEKRPLEDYSGIWKLDSSTSLKALEEEFRGLGKTIKVYDKDGNEIKTDKLTTGMKIEVVGEKTAYYICEIEDLTSNGTVTVEELTDIIRELLNDEDVKVELEDDDKEEINKDDEEDNKKEDDDKNKDENKNDADKNDDKDDIDEDDDNKDEDNKDEDNKDEDNKDDDNKDEDNKDEDNKDEDNKDEDNKDEDNKDNDNKDNDNKDEDNKDEDNKDDEQDKNKEYTITYDLANGQVEGTNPDKYTVESDEIKLINPTREGYTFLGWTGTGLDKATKDVTIAKGSTGNREYTATWEANKDTKCKVEYYLEDLKGDYKLEETKELKGETDTKATAEIKEFEGFTENEEHKDRKVEGTIKADGSLVLKVYYTRNSYELTLVKGDYIESVAGAGTYKYGEVVEITATGEKKEGYTYANFAWETEDAGILENAQEKTTKVTMPAKAVEITAKQERTVKEYTITYDLANGTVEGTNPEKYTVESDEIKLINPTRDGYTFLGWTGTGLDKATKDVVIAKGSTGNREYTATWEANGDTKYTVEYYTETLDGKYELEETKELKGETDTKATAEIKEFEGFTENTEHKDRKVEGTIKADGSLVLKVYYTRNSYELTLVKGDYIESVAGAGTYKYGEVVEITAVGEKKDGYTYANFAWETEEAGILENAQEKTTKVTMPAKAVEVTAKQEREVKEYTITYNLANGKVDGTNPDKYTVESDEIKLINPTREGYTFLGWTGTGLDKATKEVVIAKGSTGNREYTANWEANVDTEYTVEYYLEDLTGDYKLEETKELKGETDTKATAEIKEFEGFTENEEHKDRKVEGTIKADGSLVLKVYYTRNSYELTLVKGAYIESVAGAGTYKYGEVVEITAVGEKKDGYTYSNFAWETEDAGILENAQEKTTKVTMPAKAVEVTAKQERTAKEYTITYDLNNGQVEGTNPDKYTVESEEIKLINPTRDGYTFLGWTGTGLDKATKEVTIAKGSTGNREYTATWEKVRYTVSVNVNNLTSADATVTTKSNSEAEIIEGTGTGKFEYGENVDTDISYKGRDGYYLKITYSRKSENEDFTETSELWGGGIMSYSIWSIYEDATVEITLEEIPFTDMYYEVEHYVEQYDGTYSQYGVNSYNDGTTDATQKATPSEDLLNNGYVENKTHKDRIAEGKVLADGSLKLKLYYDLKEYNVTLELDDGITAELLSENTANSLDGEGSTTYKHGERLYTEVSYEELGYTAEISVIVNEEVITTWDGSSTVQFFIGEIKDDTSVEIRTTKTPVEYSITYVNCYELDEEKINPNKYTVESEEIKLINPTREGYIFIGWTGTGLDEVTEEVVIAKGSTGDREYIANWVEAVAMATQGDVKTYHRTVQSAIDSVEETGTVTLLKDISLNDDADGTATIPAEKTIELDLNEKTLTVSAVNTIVNKGKLTINGNGTIKGEIPGESTTSYVVSNSGGNLTINSGVTITSTKGGLFNNGTVNLEGGVIESTSTENYAISNSGTLNANLGEIKSTYSGIYNSKTGDIQLNGATIDVARIGIRNLDEGTIDLNSGEIISKTTSDREVIGIYNTSSSDEAVVVNGGNIEVEALGSGYAVGIHNTLAGTIDIKQGDITAKSEIGYAIGINNSGTATIKVADGANISGTSNQHFARGIVSYEGLVSVTGGTIKGTGTGNVGTYGIISYSTGANKNVDIQITGGTIIGEVTSGSSAGIGIGLSLENSAATTASTITIDGPAIVKGISDSGAAMGIYNSCSTGNIAVKGANISGLSNTGREDGINNQADNEVIVIGSYGSPTVINETSTSTSGSGYGIYQSKGTLTLTNGYTIENSIGVEYPSIKGAKYGVYVTANCTFNFYDGIIEGPIDSAIYGTVSDKPQSAEIFALTLETRELKYLVNDSVVASYKVEHYIEKEDGTYELKETETLREMPGKEVETIAKEYEGYTENTEHPDRKATGIVMPNGTLVLKVYYTLSKYDGIATTTIDGKTTGYPTVQQAIDAAGTNEGATVTLLKEEISEAVTIAQNQNIILDLNGNKLTNGKATTINNLGTLRVIGDGIIEGTGATLIHTVTNDGILIKDGNNEWKATNTGNNYVVDNNDTGTFIMNDGTLTSNDRGIYNSTNGTNNGTIEINGGTINAVDYGIYNDSSATDENNPAIKINAGEITSTTLVGIYSVRPGRIEISNATIVGNTYGIHNENTGTVIIDGANITGEKNWGVYNEANGTITVHDGYIKGNGHGVGCSTASKGVVNVYGGTLIGLTSDGLATGACVVTIGIDDGNVSQTNPHIEGKRYGVNKNATAAKVYFNDGIIIGNTSSAITSAVTGTATGYAVNTVTNETGGKTATLIGNYGEYDTQDNFINSYPTLAIAMERVTSGNVIKVERTATETIAPSVPEEKTVVLDMNNQKITLSGVSLVNNGTLTITGESGTLTSTIQAIDNASTGILNKEGNCTITGTGGYSTIYNSGKVTLSEGTIASAIYGGIYNKTAGQIIIDGGKIDTPQVGINTWSNLNTDETPAVLINDGEIKSKSANAITNYSSGGLVYVKGGNIYSSQTEDMPTIYNETGIIKVSGGSITSENDRGICNYKEGGEIIVTGGKISGETGIQNAEGSTLTLGIKDEEVSKTVPEIIGSLYGVWNLGIFNYYDGVIKGQTDSIVLNNTGDIDIPDEYEIVYRTEEIEGIVYDVAELAEIEKYTVNYYNGTTLLDSSEYVIGQSEKLETMSSLGGSKSEYTFAGWTKSLNSTEVTYEDGANVTDLTSTPNETVNLYAIWKRNVTFYSGSNLETTETKVQYYNSKGGNYSVTMPTTIKAVDGWTARGWRDDTTAASSEANGGIRSTSDAEKFYAVYTRDITFKSGLSGETTETVIQYYNTNNTKSEIEMLIPEALSGWITEGWRDDNVAGEKSYNLGQKVTPVSKTTYYAIYARDVGFYSGESNSLLETATQYYNSISAFSTTAPEKTEIEPINGWMALGWRNDTTAGASEITPGESTTISDSKFYAVYSRNITFKSGSATGNVISRNSVQYYNSNNSKSAIIMQTPVQVSNWKTVGWRDDITAGDKEYDVGASITPVSVTTYYAVYSRDITLKYNSNGGTGTMEAQKTPQYYNTSGKISAPIFTLSENAFTKANYTFSKWADGSTTGTQYAAGATYNKFIPAFSDTIFTKTMYAIWVDSK